MVWWCSSDTGCSDTRKTHRPREFGMAGDGAERDLADRRSGFGTTWQEFVRIDRKLVQKNGLKTL